MRLSRGIAWSLGAMRPDAAPNQNFVGKQILDIFMIKSSVIVELVFLLCRYPFTSPKYNYISAKYPVHVDTQTEIFKKRNVKCTVRFTFLYIFVK